MTDALPTRDFPLDRFQAAAIRAIDDGADVLVAAPTGAGKTLIAEHAIASTLADGRRAFYTSPIKALANQKMRDFADLFGASNVGLLTGDVSLHGRRPLVVMTTEVLRNMLYERSDGLDDLAVVVLDEVHYLQDRHRGPVWEEVLLHLPPSVRVVSLSATVSNVDEFAGWLREIRGTTDLIVETERPVPLEHLVAATRQHRRNGRRSASVELAPLLEGRRLSAPARRLHGVGSGGRSPSRGRGRRDGRGRSARGGRDTQRDEQERWRSPRRTELLPVLLDRDLGPVIWFVFSRAGCDEAVEQCLRSGLWFTSDAEADQLQELLVRETSEIDDADWTALGLDDWADAFVSGVASHHAGLVPAVKVAVEKAFEAGLLRAVFATETLALGVNLPARSVVLERLVKYNGESHEMLTPLEHTQLTGRAGRRGLDVRGTAVVCFRPQLDMVAVRDLVVSREFPLRSAFTPNYNMVTNLLRHLAPEQGRAFCTRSFAQYQRTVTVQQQLANLEDMTDRLAALEADAACEHGDVRAWRDEQATTIDDEALGSLRPGDLLREGRGQIVVISVAHRNGGMVVRTLSGKAKVRELRKGARRASLRVLDTLELDPDFDPNDPDKRAALAGRLAALVVDPPDGVGGCNGLAAHLDALEEIDQLNRRAAKTKRRVERTSARLVEAYDAVLEILRERHFVEAGTLTASGRVLAQVFGDCEAVLADAIDDGSFSSLDAPELAAAVSALVYEPRGKAELAFRWPTRAVRSCVLDMQRSADELIRLESRHLRQALTRRPDAGLVDVTHRWALGDPLGHVVGEEMLGGDFVRVMRQVVDTCRQIAGAAPADVAHTALEAARLIDRGVVRSGRDTVSAPNRDSAASAAGDEKRRDDDNVDTSGAD